MSIVRECNGGMLIVPPLEDIGKLLKPSIYLKDNFLGLFGGMDMDTISRTAQGMSISMQERRLPMSMSDNDVIALCAQNRACSVEAMLSFVVWMVSQTSHRYMDGCANIVYVNVGGPGQARPVSVRYMPRITWCEWSVSARQQNIIPWKEKDRVFIPQ